MMILVTGWRFLKYFTTTRKKTSHASHIFTIEQVLSLLREMSPRIAELGRY
jgi:hypothetical protein